MLPVDRLLLQPVALHEHARLISCAPRYRWEALLVVMDSKPFGDLHYILQEFADDRIWVFAEWVSIYYSPPLKCALR